MAAPTIRQSAGNSRGSGQSRSCKVTLDQPTKLQNLVAVVAVCSHGTANFTLANAGFSLVREKAQGSLKVAVWYYEGAPVMSEITVTIDKDRALSVRVVEYDGARQSGALDKVTVLSGFSNVCDTGVSGNTGQADSVVLAAVANRFGTCTQYGFTGGLAWLFDQVTPDRWGWTGYDYDENRCRLTLHHIVAAAIASWRLRCYLSCGRDWIAILVTFKGGSTGPARFSPKAVTPTIAITGKARLTAFGPLRPKAVAPTISVTGGADMWPFDFQYRLNWDSPARQLIGHGTEYPVAEIEDLEGWDMRTSDADLPRGDGAFRGIDLQAARNFSITLGMDSGDYSQPELEAKLRTLYRALVPQRDSDWPFQWRHPGQPVKQLMCRPVTNLRGMDPERLLFQDQKIALRAADPRHYSPTPAAVTVPVTPAGSDPTPVAAVNAGDANAYPTIQVTGPTSGPAVSRVELVNYSADIRFVWDGTLPSGSILVGDMNALVTSAPVSKVTLDGQPKYGGWQQPREPFFIAPGPDPENGLNLLYLRTIPEGAPVSCTLSYRDSWSG